MANSVKFMNEGFDIKYGNVKPDLCEEIYSILKKLVEAKMSPEDEKDTELLYSIYDKKMKRSNAKLSPEELYVLDKYNLQDPYITNYYGRKNVHSSTYTDSEFSGPSVFEPIKRNGPINRKVNIADRARKMNSRSDSKQDIGKYDKDYRLNYRDMRDAVSAKKYDEKQLNNIDKEFDDKEAKLRMQLDALGKEKEERKSIYQSNVKRSQSEINRLLKRESLIKESDDDYEDDDFNLYGGNAEDFMSDINDIKKALNSVYYKLATHKAEQIIDDFLSTLLKYN